jgi:hypothetical protein
MQQSIASIKKDESARQKLIEEQQTLRDILLYNDKVLDRLKPFEQPDKAVLKVVFATTTLKLYLVDCISADPRNLCSRNRSPNIPILSSIHSSEPRSHQARISH